jgi:excisionase family DNA binding protein
MARDNIEKALLGVPEVARITGLDEKSVRKAVEAQQIPALRIGRVWRVPRWWVDEQLHGSRAAVA